MKTEYIPAYHLSIPLAIGLLNDDYDFSRTEDAYSVTDLLKPDREFQLLQKLDTRVIDINGSIAALIGKALHKWFDEAWDNPEAIAALSPVLGIPAASVESLEILQAIPDDMDKLPKNYVLREQRLTKEVELFGGEKFTISGKFDLVINGAVGDYKTMSTYSYMLGDPEKFIWQMSIYRWLKPELITEDFCNIHYIITDFKANNYDKDAPTRPAFTKQYSLKSLAETEAFITSKLNVLDTELSTCTSEDLWMDPPKFKIYKDLANQARSLKNCDTYSEAADYVAKKGYGNIVEVQSKARRCNMCSVRINCAQADQLEASGLLA